MTEHDLKDFDFTKVDLAGILPQRSPFVMVSRLVSFNSQRTVTEFDIQEDNVFVEDGKLVPEGLVENIAQTCAARIGFMNKYILSKPVYIGYVCAVKDFKVMESPESGRTLTTTIDLAGDFGTILRVNADVRLGSRWVASGSMTIALDASREVTFPDIQPTVEMGQSNQAVDSCEIHPRCAAAEYRRNQAAASMASAAAVIKVADNIVSSLGTTTEENYRRVKAGESALKLYPATRELPEPYFASLIDEASLAEEYASFGIGDEYTRFEKRILLSISKALKQTDINPISEKVLFIISSTKGNVELLDPACQGQIHPADPLPAEGAQRSEEELRQSGIAGPERNGRERLGVSAKKIAEFFGNRVEPLVVSNACISGLCAQIAALRELKAGKYETAIVSGSDVQSRFIISGFQSFKALSQEACRPFDADRKGLNLGEAAATIIFKKQTPEEDSWCLSDGAIRNDANHISGPSRTGDGSYRALKALLGGIRPEDLALVSVHGTSTPYNDEMESIALTRAGLENVPVNSLKGSFGHTLGAAGILETILSMASIDDGTVLGTRGYAKCGVSCPLDITSGNRQTDKRAFLKLLSGFGGCNAAALFKKGGER